jgi:hypothetical protein
MNDLGDLFYLTIQTNWEIMKKIAGMFLLVLFVMGACGPKAYYKTAKGKKKQKYYNEIQFGGKGASEMKQRH